MHILNADIKLQDIFQGRVIQSTEYMRASEYSGKKVIVIGAGNSAFDICADLARNGVGKLPEGLSFDH
jgi:cation diffusion facilitator CzcD-associated flavoprotein CzcO